MTPKEALDLTFDCDDLGGEVTIRHYMQELLKRLFREGEGFSGKRPFGNSGWEYDLALPLVRAGLVPGTITHYDDESEETPNEFEAEYSEADVSDDRAYDAYIRLMIAEL